MLLPADEALVVRDGDLPALDLLLDDEGLGGWLGRETGEPARWRTRYLRYKRGTSCVVAGDLETAEGTRPGFASAYASDALEKVTKSLRRARSGSVLGTDPSRGLVAATPAADRDLPGLAVLDDDRGRRRVLRRLLGDRGGVRGAQVRTLSYKPQRRWVGVAQLRKGPAVVLRVYRPAEAGRVIGAIRVCAAASGTPNLIGADQSRGIAAIEYVAGGGLPPGSGTGGPGELAAIRKAGTALARLHDARGLALQDRARGAVDAVLSASDQLVTLLPDQADDIRRLSGKVAGRLRNIEHVQLPIHGDFSLDQVIVDETGTARLIDLDEAQLGDPAADLACASAALARDVVLGRLSTELAATWLRVLYEGYDAVLQPPSDERLAVHTAAHLLRRAVEPFRLRQTADWPSAARDLVSRADQIVTSDDFMEGVR